MPPKNKRPSAANAHDKRHENGLVQPAHNHRLAKQRSHSRLNGHPRDDPVGYSSSRASDLAPGLTDRALSADTYAASDFQPSQTDLDMLPPAYPEDRGDMAAHHDDVDESVEAHQDRLASNGQPPDSARESLLTAASKAILNKEFSVTVISTRPLYDIVAILILLLFLPANSLIILQMGFCYLTWGSTPSAWSPSSWVQSHGGNPSLLVTVVTDIIFLAAWLAAPFAKDYVLDFAQAVVAVKIGGGIAGELLSPPNVTCMAIITGLHITRITPSRFYNLNFLSPLLSKVDIGSFGHFSRFDPAGFAWRFHPRQRTVLRVLLEAHIIVQGIIRVVRRSVEPRTYTKRRSDPEIAAWQQSVSQHDGVANDGVAASSNLNHSDGRPPTSTTSSLSTPAHSWSSRGKRRRAEHIRKQQPFWAAIANARVSVAKDLEQTQALDDGDDGPSTGATSTIIPSSTNDRLWITNVCDKEVFFEAVLSNSKPSSTADQSREGNGSCDSRSSIIYVRVNRAKWSSMSIKESVDSETTTKHDAIHLTGQISGLTAATSFWIEFVRSDNELVLFSTNLLTRSTTNAITGSITPALQVPGLRGSSPASTLKQSIATSESQRDDQRNRVKKNRRDRRNVVNQLKKEVESVDTKLASCGGADERHRQRTYQLEQSIKQLETAAKSTASEIEALGEIPSQEQQKYAKAKQVSQANNERLKAAQEKTRESKTSDDSSINSSRSARDNIIQKRERLEGRITTNAQRQEELTTEITQRLQESDKKEQHRASVSAWRDGKERELMSSIVLHENARQHFDSRRVQLEQETYKVYANPEHHSFSGQPFIPASSIPETPEPVYAGLNGQGSVRFPNFVPNPVGTPPVHSRRSSLVGAQKPRGRSSSMLSDISGLTEDEYTPVASQFTHAGFTNGFGHPSMPTANSFGFPQTSGAPFGDIIWASDSNRKRSSGSGSFSFTPGAPPQRTNSGSNGHIGQHPQRDTSSTSPITKQSPIGSSRARSSPTSNGK